MSSEENLFFSVLRRKAQGGFKYTIKIYSWLLSCFTARGSGTGFYRVSPVKVKGDAVVPDTVNVLVFGAEQLA